MASHSLDLVSQGSDPASRSPGLVSQPSKLEQLPKELLDNITSWLPTLDFNSFRCTSREIESKSFEYWSNAFFKKRQFMIDEFSLQTLVDISEHAALSKFMTHLIIGLDELQASHRLSRVDSVAEFSRWRAADCAQRALLHGGGAAQLLSKALANLPNLKTIDLRDFNSNTRYRDAIPGQEAPQWRSYGSSRYQQWPRETEWLVRLTAPTTFTDTVFTVVLAAVARSAPTVKNLEVILRNRQICIQDDAFSTFGIPGTPLANTLPALTKLHLDLDSQGSPAHPCPPQVDTPQHAWFDPCTAYLRRFLALTPNVSWLRLNFHLHRNNSSLSSPPSKLITWLALRHTFNAPLDAPWGEGNPVPIALPLQRLDLGNVTTSLVALRALLKKFVDLEHISMRLVRLQGPAATSVQNVDSSDTTGDCVWARLIRTLRLNNPKLKKLELSRIWEDADGSFTSIVFVDEHDPTLYSSSTSTRIDTTKDTDRLAENTYTITRWEKSQQKSESTDGNLSVDSLDDMSLDGDEIEDEIEDEDEEIE